MLELTEYWDYRHVPKPWPSKSLIYLNKFKVKFDDDLKGQLVDMGIVAYASNPKRYKLRQEDHLKLASLKTIWAM